MLIRAVWLEAHIFGWAVNRDTALDADRFAQFTADAFFLVDDGDLEKFGMIRAGLHGNTIEGTDINAELAGRAGFRVDFSFRNRQGLDLFNRVAGRVNDGFHRAMDTADTAIDAKGRINVKHRFFFARDGLGRTFDGAKSTADAVFKNDVWHAKPL